MPHGHLRDTYGAYSYACVYVWTFSKAIKWLSVFELTDIFSREQNVRETSDVAVLIMHRRLIVYWKEWFIPGWYVCDILFTFYVPKDFQLKYVLRGKYQWECPYMRRKVIQVSEMTVTILIGSFYFTENVSGASFILYSPYV